MSRSGWPPGCNPDADEGPQGLDQGFSPESPTSHERRAVSQPPTRPTECILKLSFLGEPLSQWPPKTPAHLTSPKSFP